MKQQCAILLLLSTVLIGCHKPKVLSVSEDATLHLCDDVKECVEESFYANIQFGDTILGDPVGEKRIIRFDKEGRELSYFITLPSRNGRDTTMFSYDYNPSGLITKKQTIRISPDTRTLIDEQYHYSEKGLLVAKTETMYDTIRSIFGEYGKTESLDTTYGYYLNYDSTSYEYDNKGNLIKEWSYSMNGDSIKLDYMKRHQYDSNNKEISGAEYNPNGTLNHSWEMSYSPDGSYSLRDSSLLLQEERGLCDYYRYVIEYKYNHGGQLIYRYKNSHYNKGHYVGNRLNCRNNAFYKEILKYNESGMLSSVEAFEYDLKKQDFKEESWVISFEYDQDNHLIRVDKPRFLPWYVMQDPYYKLLTHIEPHQNLLKKDKYNWIEQVNPHSGLSPITITKRTISYW